MASTSARRRARRGRITRNNLGNGDYNIIARVVTNANVVASSAVTTISVIPPNDPPVVTLTSPTNNGAYGTGTTLTLTATATDSDEHREGRVLSRHDEDRHGHDVRRIRTPGRISRTGRTRSRRRRTTRWASRRTSSRRRSSCGRWRRSRSVRASPTAGTEAMVTVTGAAFCTAVNVDFGDGNVQTFMNDGVGLPMTNPHTWATAGTKTITAQGLGGACNSQATTEITVLSPPTVSVTSPANNTTYSTPATVELTASASAAGSASITQVDFYRRQHAAWDLTTSAPYTYTWSNAPEGTHSVKAKAIDSLGALGVSSSVTVIVGDLPASTVFGVSVSPNPVVAGNSATITITGTNPCTMLWVDFGDGDWWIQPTYTLPYQTTHTWTSSGTYTVMAKGFLTCGGEVTTSVTVNSSAPRSAQPAERRVVRRSRKATCAAAIMGGAVRVAAHERVRTSAVAHRTR